MAADSEKKHYRERYSRWTESIALGSEGFVSEPKEKLGAKAMWQEIAGASGSYELRESMTVYEIVFDPKNGKLTQEKLPFCEAYLFENK